MGEGQPPLGDVLGASPSGVLAVSSGERVEIARVLVALSGVPSTAGGGM